MKSKQNKITDKQIKCLEVRKQQWNKKDDQRKFLEEQETFLKELKNDEISTKLAAEKTKKKDCKNLQLVDTE